MTETQEYVRLDELTPEQLERRAACVAAFLKELGLPRRALVNTEIEPIAMVGDANNIVQLRTREMPKIDEPSMQLGVEKD